MRQSVLAVKDLANRAGQGISMNPESLRYNRKVPKTGIRIMEYTIEEMQAMLNIVSAVLDNRRFECNGSSLRTSTIYNIDDFDIETMQKWTAY